jgi:hypothetical protein
MPHLIAWVLHLKPSHQAVQQSSAALDRRSLKKHRVGDSVLVMPLSCVTRMFMLLCSVGLSRSAESKGPAFDIVITRGLILDDLLQFNQLKPRCLLGHGLKRNMTGYG